MGKLLVEVLHLLQRHGISEQTKAMTIKVNLTSLAASTREVRTPSEFEGCIDYFKVLRGSGEDEPVAGSDVRLIMKGKLDLEDVAHMVQNMARRQSSLHSQLDAVQSKIKSSDFLPLAGSHPFDGRHEHRCEQDFITV